MLFTHVCRLRPKQSWGVPGLVTALALMAPSITLPCFAQGEYIVEIDRTNGNYNKIGSAIAGIMWVYPNVRAYNETNGTYIFQGGTITPDHLFSIDVTDGSIISNPLFGFSDGREFKFDNSTGTLYGLFWDTVLSQLFLETINPATGAHGNVSTTPISGLNSTYQGFSTFDEINHTYIIFAPGDVLYSIDAVTGIVSSNPTLSLLPGESVVTISYDNSTDILYGLLNDSNISTFFLVSINTSTGAVTKIGPGTTLVYPSGSSAIDRVHQQFLYLYYNYISYYHVIAAIDISTGNLLSNNLLASSDIHDNFHSVEYDNTLDKVLAIHWDADTLLGSLGGFKFNNLNGNCVKDSLEPGLPGWTINLSGPGLSLSTTTDSFGWYCFDSLLAGTYTVSEVLQSGWTQTCPALPGSYTVNLGTGQHVTGLNFGNRRDTCVTPPQGMVGWWPLDETSGTTVADIVEGFNGTTLPGPIGPEPGPGPVPSTLWPPPPFSPGKVNTSLFFGAGRYVRVPNNSALDPGTGDFTIDAWFAWGGGTGPIVQKMLPGFPGYRLNIYSDDPQQGGGLSFEAGGSPGGGFALNHFPFTRNQWHHVAGTIQRGSPDVVRLYLDGQLVENITAQAFPAGATIGTNEDLLIGGDAQTPGARIAVDEVEIFNRALDSSEVRNIWAADSLGKCKPDTVTFGSLCGFKYNDVNSNCVKDSIEQGLSGWTINLSGPVSLSTTTNSLGQYCFTSLPAGTYTVSEILQTGWIQTCPPLPGTYIQTILPGQAINNLNFGNRIDTVTGINKHTEIPTDFGLLQNSPNPFNPTTTIEYQLPVPVFVKISVFDILGREIALLVNENKSAGKYRVTFDAGTLPAGAYFCRIQAGQFRATRKLVLLK
jgi:hypothetical protein